MILHPGHPLRGRRLSVVRRNSQRGERQWIIELPDGSRQYVPASWCTPLVPPSLAPSLSADAADAMDESQSPGTTTSPLCLTGLRELAALVGHLRDAGRPGRGEQDAGPSRESRQGRSLPGRTLGTTEVRREAEPAVADLGELPDSRASTAGEHDRPDGTSPSSCQPDQPAVGGEEVGRPCRP